MSKGGVTFTEVKNAVEQLRKQGINPSVDNILKFIGHGSKTTIHKHLKALLRSERGLLGELGLISDDLAGLVIQLHNQLKAESQKVIDVAAERTAAVIAHVKEQLKDEMAQTKELGKELQSRATELTAERQHSNDLSSKLGAAQQEIARLAQQLTDLQGTFEDAKRHIGKLDHDLKTAHENNRHFQDAAATQIKQIRTEHSTEVSKLQAEKHDREATIAELRTSTVELNRQNSELIARLSSEQASTRRLENQSSKLQSEIDQLRRDLSASEIERATAAAKIEMLTSQVQHNQEELKSLNAALVESQRGQAQQEIQNSTLRTELAALQAIAAAGADTPDRTES
ncbi:DNA-binding protein [Aquipseudomonas alcaligenes]|uniref:KfrA N-terminal DNA-binding domain-containing protein n=1 Tax=Aquipseudomonas alcaligenes (strain ATCC 14909 / DSM 50342 / CCUG 1425 / JCM 20561 / NBRC 14159 / NCIMB 9945 / NCTC 10367 / 1577) TaxID=1215092 RepID=U2ZUH1_AQUA1|nr:DNA-binding protein [Pseudomonas alcaligenes]EKY0806308.1 DNA-binding protein [Pseudomonas aeruginosa]GAD65100.1 hypothetical protein PA6_069_00040 [Pseudomonas alcaligenes NBRC 14159]SUD12984.1 cointegrate resolution protein T [Pseudomonas alcaligenes]